MKRFFVIATIAGFYVADTNWELEELLLVWTLPTLQRQFGTETEHYNRFQIIAGKSEIERRRDTCRCLLSTFGSSTRHVFAKFDADRQDIESSWVFYQTSFPVTAVFLPSTLLVSAILICFFVLVLLKRLKSIQFTQLVMSSSSLTANIWQIIIQWYFCDVKLITFIFFMFFESWCERKHVLCI